MCDVRSVWHCYIYSATPPCGHPGKVDSSITQTFLNVPLITSSHSTNEIFPSEMRTPLKWGRLSCSRHVHVIEIPLYWKQSFWWHNLLRINVTILYSACASIGPFPAVSNFLPELKHFVYTCLLLTVYFCAKTAGRNGQVLYFQECSRWCYWWLHVMLRCMPRGYLVGEVILLEFVFVFNPSLFSSQLGVGRDFHVASLFLHSVLHVTQPCWNFL